jgi:hypothetical protein
MKKILLFLFVMYSVNSFSQQYRNTEIENYIVVRNSLKKFFGKEWYCKFESKDTNGFYFRITVDSTGKVLQLKEYKIFSGITKRELKKFYIFLKNNERILIENPDPHFSFKDYISQNENRLPYIFRFNPLKVEIMINRYKFQ